MKTNHIALGLLGGIAAGAILGILFAPAKGEETRKKIQQKGSDYADSLKDKFGNLSGVLKNNVEKIVDEGKDLVDENKTKFDNIKKINPNILS
jgi:gas vesicle protein